MRGAINAWLIALFVALGGVPGVAREQNDSRSDTTVKAMFLFNFAKFTEWPSRESVGPLMLCVIGDPRVARELADTTRGQRIGDRSVQVSEIRTDGPIQSCHVLFISQSEVRKAKEVLAILKTLPILTVSDNQGFARADGIIEFFIDSERMRFAVNKGAVDRAGVRLSSRLLGLARIEGDNRGP
jgi:hypothetical protein